MLSRITTKRQTQRKMLRIIQVLKSQSNQVNRRKLRKSKRQRVKMTMRNLTRLGRSIMIAMESSVGRVVLVKVTRKIRGKNLKVRLNTQMS